MPKTAGKLCNHADCIVEIHARSTDTFAAVTA